MVLGSTRFSSFVRLLGKQRKARMCVCLRVFACVSADEMSGVCQW